MILSPSFVVDKDESAQATKIFLSKGASNDSYSASGVEFSSASQTFTVNATREVILSAGAVGTPQLLELSGMSIRLWYHFASLT